MLAISDESSDISVLDKDEIGEGAESAGEVRLWLPDVPCQSFALANEAECL
jgi:hypothetical protein